jgi:hypothetical protein
MSDNVGSRHGRDEEYDSIAPHTYRASNWQPRDTTGRAASRDERF